MLWMLTLVLPMCCQCVANVFANVPGGCDAVDAHAPFTARLFGDSHPDCVQRSRAAPRPARGGVLAGGVGQGDVVGTPVRAGQGPPPG